MALQDLTPQLRTRLSRVERAVGVFVLVATVLLLAGFAYYLHHKARTRGWFLTKVPYYTYSDSASGMKIGDKVNLMGFEVGEITGIKPMPPKSEMEVMIEFTIKESWYTYLYSGDSYAKVTAQGFLGSRTIEVVKGTNGPPTYVSYNQVELSLADARALPATNQYVLFENLLDANVQIVAYAMAPLRPELIDRLQAMNRNSVKVFDTTTTNRAPIFVWDSDGAQFASFDIKHPSNMYLLPPHEPPSLSDVLEKITTRVNNALPGIFNLTNQLAAVLTNSSLMVSNANDLVSRLKPVVTDADTLLAGVRPAVTNLNGILRNLNGTNGALGEWLIPQDLHAGLNVTISNASATLANANVTLTNVDTNILVLVESLNKTLENLASITSNLNAQVEANTNLVTGISTAIIHSDDLIQGLKRHWLLRSAFKTNKPPVKATPPKPR